MTLNPGLVDLISEEIVVVCYREDTENAPNIFKSEQHIFE